MGHSLFYLFSMPTFCQPVCRSFLGRIGVVLPLTERGEVVKPSKAGDKLRSERQAMVYDATELPSGG